MPRSGTARARLDQNLTSKPILVGQVTDCTVAGDPAAFFQYTAKRSQLVDSKPGDWTGYMVVFVHHHVPNNLPYALRIEGTGGIDPRAIHDAKAILASWTWGAG
ncbi:MAG: hypothetical protein M3082_19395 [Candidatus Dormibacteraeota bacterium]|nr:hypothetical protein [Candidatus Dormibacteraeota bacterium]